MNHDYARDDEGPQKPDPERDALEQYEAWLFKTDAPETRRTKWMTPLMLNDIERWDWSLGE